ncbi:MAG: hypothetical protein V1857_04930 [archaeon]
MSDKRPMQGGQRRTATAWSIILLVTVALATDVLIRSYLMAHGLKELPATQLGLANLHVSILSLPFLGIVALLMSSWQYVTRGTVSTKLQRGRRTERSDGHLRSLNVALSLAATFATIMFVPYLAGSVLFFRVLSLIGSLAPWAEKSSLALVDWFYLTNRLDELAKYSVSVVASAALIMFVSMLMVRRKPKLVESRSR